MFSLGVIGFLASCKILSPCVFKLIPYFPLPSFTVARRTSMFDDPAVEIQELTAVIKQDITALNSSIEDLQRICESRDGASRNKHTNDYSTTVVDSLKSRLMTATKSFKDVLTLRTEVRILVSLSLRINFLNIFSNFLKFYAELIFHLKLSFS